jgi:hypothetical protein
MRRHKLIVVAAFCLCEAACAGLFAQYARLDNRLPDEFPPAYCSHLMERFRKYKAGKISEILKVDMLNSTFQVHVADSGRGEVYGFAPYRGAPLHFWLLTAEYEAFAFNDEAIFVKVGQRYLSRFR